MTTPTRSRLLRVAAVLSAASFALACGGTKPEPKTENWVVENDSEPEKLDVMQEYGGMNQEKVDRVFKRVQGDLAQCMLDGQKRVEFLGGDVAFYLEVDLTGHAKSAHIEQSNLGDYDTEQCMLNVLREQKWPKPVGGKLGKITSSIGFDPPEDVRPPVAWEAEDAEKAVEKINSELSACGGGGPFSVTAYVKTNGSVLSAGVAHTDDKGDAAAACIVDAVKHAKFGSPGSWPAKVTFRR